MQGLNLMFNEFNFNPNNPSNYFGYPNLGRPNDHFDVTPFEAIYVGERIHAHIVLEDSEPDPGDYNVEPNADLRLKANESIHLKPGTSFYAGITDENCTCGGLSGKSGQMNNQNNYTNIEDATREISEYEINPVNSLVVRLYPNPGKDIVNLVVEHEIAHGFEYKVFSTMGVLVEEKQIDGYTAKLTLRKGMYIIKVKYKGEWRNRKLIMQ